MVCIKIHNVLREREAKPLRDLLHDQTYMKLQVTVCPVGGSCAINVETHDPDITEAELTSMVLGLLSHQIIRARRANEFDRESSDLF